MPRATNLAGHPTSPIAFSPLEPPRVFTVVIFFDLLLRLHDASLTNSGHQRPLCIPFHTANSLRGKSAFFPCLAGAIFPLNTTLVAELGFAQASVCYR